jgi:hypothetical protein
MSAAGAHQQQSQSEVNAGTNIGDVILKELAVG